MRLLVVFSQGRCERATQCTDGAKASQEPLSSAGGLVTVHLMVLAGVAPCWHRDAFGVGEAFRKASLRTEAYVSVSVEVLAQSAPAGGGRWRLVEGRARMPKAVNKQVAPPKLMSELGARSDAVL